MRAIGGARGGAGKTAASRAFALAPSGCLRKNFDGDKVPSGNNIQAN